MLHFPHVCPQIGSQMCSGSSVLPKHAEEGSDSDHDCSVWREKGLESPHPTCSLN